MPLNESVRQALAGYLAPLLYVEPTLKAVAVAWPCAPCEPVWASERGEQLSVREMSRMIQEQYFGCTMNVYRLSEGIVSGRCYRRFCGAHFVAKGPLAVACTLSQVTYCLTS